MLPEKLLLVQKLQKNSDEPYEDNQEQQQVTEFITRRMIQNGEENHGTVFGTENKQIFVKYGGTYLRVNPCYVRAVSDKGKPSNTNKDSGDQGNCKLLKKKLTVQKGR